MPGGGLHAGVAGPGNPTHLLTSVFREFLVPLVEMLYFCVSGTPQQKVNPSPILLAGGEAAGKAQL